jgi:hypothetical protein
MPLANAPRFFREAYPRESLTQQAASSEFRQISPMTQQPHTEATEHPSGNRKVFAFPDTNVFMHFRLFSELNWPEIVRAKEVTLMLTTTVFSQLDYRKERDERPKMRERVKVVLRALKNALQGNSALPAGVAVQYYPTDASNACRKYALDPGQTDQYLVAIALTFRDQHPEKAIGVITGDYGMMMLAAHHGLMVVEVPDELKLEAEDSDDAKKVRELQQELARDRSRRAKLKIATREGASFVRVALPSPDKALESIQARLDEADTYLARKHPPLIGRTALLPGGIRYAQQALFGVSEEAMSKYNDALVTFYARYKDWLREMQTFARKESRSVELTLYLVNAGTAAATQLIIELRFPSSVTVQGAKPEPPAPPEPPRSPRPFAADTLASSLYTGFGLGGRLRDIENTLAKPNVSKPSLSRQGSLTTVTLRVEQVVHNVPVSLGKLFITWNGEDAPIPFAIECTIHTASLPEPTPGTFHVVPSESPQALRDSQANPSS